MLWDEETGTAVSRKRLVDTSRGGERTGRDWLHLQEFGPVRSKPRSRFESWHPQKKPLSIREGFLLIIPKIRTKNLEPS